MVKNDEVENNRSNQMRLVWGSVQDHWIVSLIRGWVCFQGWGSIYIAYSMVWLTWHCHVFERPMQCLKCLTIKSSWTKTFSHQIQILWTKQKSHLAIQLDFFRKGYARFSYSEAQFRKRSSALVTHWLVSGKWRTWLTVGHPNALLQTGCLLYLPSIFLN